MPRQVLYFDEYTCTPPGEILTASPYLENGVWAVYGIRYSLQEIVKMCNLSDSEFIMLRLTYGG
jgi:hypothetical protein